MRVCDQGLEDDARPRVVLHTCNYGRPGGISSVVRSIQSSCLSAEYSFCVVSQDSPARGINFPLIASMASAMRKLRPSIVHVNGLQNEGFHGMMAAKLVPGARIVLGVHGFIDDVMEYSRWRKVVIGRFLEPITVRCADAVYSVCRHASHRRMLVRNARWNAGCIHNGVPEPQLQRSAAEMRAALQLQSDDVVAVCVCRMAVDKGVRVLADAYVKMRTCNMGVPRLLLVGDGPDVDLLRRRLAPLLEDGTVKMLGARSDIADLNRASDFFVLPTFHENLSMAILEAMMAGRAILTTPVGGNPELVEQGRHGILVPAGDVDALIQAIQQLACDTNLRKTLGAAARDRAMTLFTTDVMSRKIGDVYSKLIRKQERKT